MSNNTELKNGTFSKPTNELEKLHRALRNDTEDVMEIFDKEIGCVELTIDNKQIVHEIIEEYLINSIYYDKPGRCTDFYQFMVRLLRVFDALEKKYTLEGKFG